jgi:hypothetical protein
MFKKNLGFMIQIMMMAQKVLRHLIQIIQVKAIYFRKFFRLLIQIIQIKIIYFQNCIFDLIFIIMVYSKNLIYLFGYYNSFILYHTQTRIDLLKIFTNLLLKLSHLMSCVFLIYFLKFHYLKLILILFGLITILLKVILVADFAFSNII